MCVSKCTSDDAQITSYACLCVTNFAFTFVMSSFCRVSCASVCVTGDCRLICLPFVSSMCVCYLVKNILFTFGWISFLARLLLTGSTLIIRDYLNKYPSVIECTGEYTIKTYTIGACSTGGVKYQIVSGTASLVPSAAPTAFSSALTLQLSGYSVSAQYSDDRCTTMISAVSYPLNSCNDNKDMFRMGGYEKYTATAYTIARTEYSDSLCTTAVSALGPTYTDYTGTCKSINFLSYITSPGLILVNSNGVPPSSLAMASIRLVLITSISCPIASLRFSRCWRVALRQSLRIARNWLTRLSIFRV